MFSVDKLKTEATVKIWNWFNSNWQILILVIVLFVSYFPLFHSFQAANYDLIKGSSIEAQIWLFLSSDGFKWVTTAFLFPIFSLFISNKFKVKERMEERLIKREIEKKKIIYNAISQTQDLWKDITNLSSTLRYYTGEEPIEDIRFELDEFNVKMREVKNTWHLVFNNLKDFRTMVNYLKLLEKPIYVFYAATNTVAQNIHDKSLRYRISRGCKSQPKYEIANVTYRSSLEKGSFENHYFLDKDLVKNQYALGVIQTGISNIFYSHILTILKNYVDKEFGETLKIKNIAENKIRTDLENMELLYDKLAEVENRHNKVFSFLKHDIGLHCVNQGSNKKMCKDECKVIQSHFKASEDRLRQDHEENKEVDNEELNKYSEFKELNKSHSNLGYYKRRYAISPPYSPRCMEELAKCLDFREIKNDLIDRAEWPLLKNYLGDDFSIKYFPIWQKKDMADLNISKIASIVIPITSSEYLSDRPNPDDWILSYKNKLKGFVYTNYNDDINSRQYKNLILHGFPESKIDRDILEINMEDIKNEEIKEFRTIFGCNENLNIADVKEPFYVDRKMIIKDQNAYLFELIVSKQYYENNVNMINKTMESFKVN